MTMPGPRVARWPEQSPQISVELELDKGRVLNHWAVCKIDVSSTLRDEELEEILSAKVSDENL